MKKSKFLKKSLAMLLAVMLVVAMIPLSASAAELPNLTKLYIDGTAFDASNGVFSANVFYDEPNITLRGEENSMGMQGGSVADLAVVKEGTSETLPIEVGNGTPTPVDLTKWAVATDNGWKLTLRVSSGSAYKDYTVELTKVSYGQTASLTNGQPGTGVYAVSINNANHKIDLTVPKNYPGYTPVFTVETQDGAKITTSGNITQDANKPEKYTINVTGDGMTFNVTSESEANVAEWTVNVNPVSNLTAFALGDYVGTIDQTAETVTVEVPRADLYNQYGKLQNIVVPVNYDTYALQTTVSINGTNYADGASFTIPVAADEGDLINKNDAIVLDCAGINDVQKYNLVVKVAESSSTAIKAARFADELIESVDGTTISAVLPSTTTLSQIRVILYTDAADHVDDITGFEATNDSRYVMAGMDAWISGVGGNNYLDLSKDRIVTVTAEDGTTQTYTLSASLAETKTEATVQSIYLKKGDVQIKGSVSNNTITFDNVPYMTLNLNDWAIYTTPDSINTTITAGGKAVINGSTKGDVLGLGELKVGENANKAVEAVVATNKNDPTVFTKYDVIVNLADPTKTGKTLTDLEISIQNVNPENDQTNAEVYDRVTAYNSIKANDKSITIETGKNVNNNTGTITLKPADSLSGATNQWNEPLFNILTKIETNGVAFLAKNVGGNYTNAIELSSLADNLSDFSGTVMDYSWKLIVLPEDAARNVYTENDTQLGTYGYFITSKEFSRGTVYSFNMDPQDPSGYNTISDISVNGTALKVTESTDIIGELPYSATETGMFIDFTLSPHARVRTDAGTYWLRDGGDTNEDGVANRVGNTNVMLMFKRNTDKTVDVYYSNDGENFGAKLTNNQITVVAENGSTKTYTFKLTWAEPNTDPLITAFSIDGYTGSINGENITVTLPYGTDLKGLVPTFTTSSGATVTLGGESVVSGKTFVNFSHPVQLLVTAEDKQHTKPYTVTVKTANAFKDVNTNDWFYDDVMAAASAGIVKGQGDGIFAPKASVTRRDFAIMLCRVLGVDVEGTAVSPFVDVNEYDYGIVAIAYCAAHGIVNGYEDTTFQPNKTITRQEAAKMISAAMGVSNISDELYTDDAKIADWASDYVYMAKAAGLMKGDTDGSFRPNDQITRAEAATIMMNAYNQ